MSSTSFYTDAGNFVSAIQGGVDPRTGLFNVNLSLANLRSGNLAGPGLNLALRYSPLSNKNDGFGRGFTLNLTRYDTIERRLHLSSGESYPVTGSAPTVRQHKLSHFVTEGSQGVITRVIHKSGLVEELSRYGFMALTSRIVTPDGRGLSLQWDWSDKAVPVRLSAVTESRDGRNVTLCSISYSDGPEKTATVTVLPEDPDFGYDTVFSVQDEVLRSVTSHAASPALIWTFGYDNTYFPSPPRYLTRIKHPTGMEESVIYPDDTGASFPDGIDLPALPRVSSHSLIPGNLEPAISTSWTWSEENYLGRNAPGQDRSGWTPDSDIMLGILNPDYFYSSTAKIRVNSIGQEFSEVTRHYNNFHQLVSESTLRDGKLHTINTTYYARSGATMAEQPAQYQLPLQQVETWASDTRSRSRVTRWAYDRAGNLIKEWSPDGTITRFSWYSALGEGDACPADPHGFTRYLKTRRVAPRRIRGDEVRTVTRHYWKKLDSLSGDTYVILPDREVETTVLPATSPSGSNTPRLRTQVSHTYHSESENRVTYGRESRRATAFWPDVAGSPNESYTQTQDFSYESSQGGFSQGETLTTHDNLSLTRSTLRHPVLGHLLSGTDAQGVVTKYTWDKVGRKLTQTQASGSAYERTAACEYVISETGPMVTTTDPRGNQTKVFYDKSGRERSRQQLDHDGGGLWYEVSSRTFSRLGEISTSSASDWLTASATQYTVGTTVEYDGYGNVSKQTTSDGVTITDTTDPVGLTRTVASSGGGMTSATRKTELTPHLRLPRKEVLSGGDMEIVRKYRWDGHGRLREMTDENGYVTTYTWDDAGRLLTQTLPDGTVVTRSWARHLSGSCLTGLSITGKDGEGNTKTWQQGTQEFDGLGRLTTSMSGGRHLLYFYEGASPVPKSVMTTSGNIIAYTRAVPLNNALMALSASPGSESQAPAVDQTFTRDPLTGSLLTATEGNTKTVNTLSPSGQLKSEAFLSVSGEHRSTSYTRTLCGAVSQYTDPTDTEMSRVRDNFGRLIRIEDGDLTASLSYDALGRITGRTVTNPVTKVTLTTALEYDALGRELTRTVTGSDKTAMKQTLTWSPGSQLTGRVTQSGELDVLTEGFTYDSRNRLTDYTATGSQLPKDAYGQEITSQHYIFDALNNLFTVTTTLKAGGQDVAAYHYDNADDPTQLTSVTHTHDVYPPAITLTYDADGRMTQDETGRALSYDATGRLVCVGSSPDSTYGYDALNRLVTQNVGNSDTRSLYYQGNVQVCEVKNLNQITRLIKSGHTSLGVSDDSGVTLTAVDRHDSLLLARGAGQAEGAPQVWSPYGGGVVADGLPGFNGERSDPLSGNYHPGNGYRAYSPQLMRFTCPDSLSPFGAGGINPYAYCAGDPVNFTDPSGHISTEGWTGIALGTMGLAISVMSFFLFPAMGPVALMVGAFGVVADVTSIASGAMDDTNPEASGILGYISLGTGLVGLGMGGVMAISGGMTRAAVRYPARQALQEIEMQPLRRSSMSQSTHSVAQSIGSLAQRATGFEDLPPGMIRNIGHYLSLEDLKALRATSMQTKDAITVRDLRKSFPPVQRFASAFQEHEVDTLLMMSDLEPYTGRILRMDQYSDLHGITDEVVNEMRDIIIGYRRGMVFDPETSPASLFADVRGYRNRFLAEQEYMVNIHDLEL